MTHLVLGTAQWGSAYGATNIRGWLSDDEVADIVESARLLGISEVDTSSGYGNSLERLSDFAPDFRVTSKALGTAPLEPQVAESLRRMRRSEIDTLLVHDWDSLSREQREMSLRQLEKIRRDGLIRHIGISTYEVTGIESAVVVANQEGIGLAAIQVPTNLLDRRLDENALLEELAQSGVSIYGRSVFLQGLLLATSSAQAHHPDVASFHDSVGARDDDLAAMRACLQHVKSLNWITHVVVGVTAAKELKQIANIFSDSEARRGDLAWGSDDLDLIDPRRW